MVNVKPALHVGGAACVAADYLAKEAVMVEFIQAKAGLDIGDTLIGRHIQHVQVPLRIKKSKLVELM